MTTGPDGADSNPMDHETLYTASKWDILKCLERGPASPLALSAQCATSIANVSQQLRLLEMAGLVSSERVSNRDKGKPRILYKIAGNLSYVITTADKFVEKKPLQLTDINKVIMRIWFFSDAQLRYALEKAFWKIEEHFEKISFLGIDTAKTRPLTFAVSWSGKPVELKPFTITEADGTERQIVFTNTLPPASRLYILHDPHGTILRRERHE